MGLLLVGGVCILVWLAGEDELWSRAIRVGSKREEFGLFGRTCVCPKVQILVQARLSLKHTTQGGLRVCAICHWHGRDCDRWDRLRRLGLLWWCGYRLNLYLGHDRLMLQLSWLVERGLVRLGLQLGDLGLGFSWWRTLLFNNGLQFDLLIDCFRVGSKLSFLQLKLRHLKLPAKVIDLFLLLPDELVLRDYLGLTHLDLDLRRYLHRDELRCRRCLSR